MICSLIGSFIRQVAVDYLVDNMKESLYLEKEESVPVYELLSVVAAQYNMTAENYCEVNARTCLHRLCRCFLKYW